MQHFQKFNEHCFNRVGVNRQTDRPDRQIKNEYYNPGPLTYAHGKVYDIRKMGY